MSKKSTNPCIICGKDRMVIKTYTEKSDSGILTYVITSCPDPECQKKVDGVLAKEKAYREYMRGKFEEREKERTHRVQLSRSKNKKSYPN